MRPQKELVRQIVAPPYDVVNGEEARAYARGNPRSFFGISRPEVNLPPGTDEHADAVYLQGRKTLEAFIAEGWLQQDETPCFYLYRQRMGSHVQTGVVASASVAEYDAQLIKRHELTRADKEHDRTRHIDTLGGNDEPVLLIYRSYSVLDALVEEGARSVPEYDFITEDGIRHTFWMVRDALNSALEEAFRAVPALYIADGHHRSAAASRVHALRSQRGGGGHDRFLAVVFPCHQMQILEYNRVVKDLCGLTPEDLLQKLTAHFQVVRGAQKKPDRAHGFGMYLGGGAWYQFTAKPEVLERMPEGVLDVTILQHHVLEPLLGIRDPRKDTRIHFVGGIRGVEELERLVDGGDWAVAFSLHPTSLEQLMAISDAGGIMPPKSTWFEPKLRSGLVLHLF